MSTRSCLIAALALSACAKAQEGVPDAPPGSNPDSNVDASCGNQCDHDHDGVIDGNDKCPGTPQGQVVNHDGCSDSQLTPTLQPFPPFGLLWTSGGDPGRPAGLTWTYTGINRGDLFHIYWVICDDPATPCGVSLDGPIDAAGEAWTFSITDSDAANGKVVFTNTTGVLLADTTVRPLMGRLTVHMTDDQAVPIAFQTVESLGIPPQASTYGGEVGGTAFVVTALIEVKDASSAWTPYLDYYDAAPTPPAGGGTAVSFGGSFYAK